ncbi:MAG: alpha/beta hydrolase [Sandaracinaceae bacterium]|nr:alpha/beta hydrolase [Sandaracinaceae bacterium]
MSTFTSVVDLGQPPLPAPARFVVDLFDSAAVLRSKPGRVLHLHGRRDELVPFAHAEALAAITGGPLLAEEGGHNDCPLDWRLFVERAVEFVGPKAS